MSLPKIDTRFTGELLRDPAFVAMALGTCNP